MQKREQALIDKEEEVKLEEEKRKKEMKEGEEERERLKLEGELGRQRSGSAYSNNSKEVCFVLFLFAVCFVYLRVSW